MGRLRRSDHLGRDEKREVLTMTVKRAIRIYKRMTREDRKRFLRVLTSGVVKLFVGCSVGCLVAFFVMGLPELLADIFCFVLGVA